MIDRTDPISYAKKIGVNIGYNVKLVDNPNWGSEPYVISIGDNTLISGGVSFITHDYSVRVFKNLGRNKDIYKFGKINVGKNCFIGSGSTIMLGVTIGDNCIVSAGALVTHDIPNNQVWGGVPARHLLDLEEYEQKCIDTCPRANPDDMKKNKKNEILRMVNEYEKNKLHDM